MKPCIVTDQISQDFQLACSIISEQGINHVEIHTLWGKTIELLDDDQIRKAKSFLDFYDLKVDCLASTFFLMTPLYPDDILKDFNPKFNILRSDYDSQLDILKRTILTAKTLGCSRLRIFPFYAPVNRLILGTPKDIETMCERLMPAVRLAQEAGITLLLENCYHSHLPKGLLTLELVRRIDSPHLKLLYNPANSYRASKERIPLGYREAAPVEELKAMLPWVDHLHFKDYHYVEGLNQPYQHAPLGKGEVPYPQLLSMLKEAGYMGSLSCEPEVTYEGNMESLSKLMNWIRETNKK